MSALECVFLREEVKDSRPAISRGFMLLPPSYTRIDALLSKNASKSLRKILTNFPLGLHARRRPALIMRSTYRTVDCSSSAACCFVRIAELAASACGLFWLAMLAHPFYLGVPHCMTSGAMTLTAYLRFRPKGARLVASLVETFTRATWQRPPNQSPCLRSLRPNADYIRIRSKILIASNIAHPDDAPFSFAAYPCG